MRKLSYWWRVACLKLQGKQIFYPLKIEGYEHAGHQVLMHKDDGKLYWVCVDGCPDKQEEEFIA